MQYRYGFLARAADVMPDGSFAVLGGGYNYLLLAEMPGFVNVAVVTAFAVEAADYGREHRFMLEVRDPSGRRLVQLEGAGRPERSPEFPDATLDFVFVFNVISAVVADPGEYRFGVAVDGEQVGSVALLVEKRGDQT